MSRVKEIIDKKYMIPQVKYITNLTLTTEKHAINMAETDPKSASPKKHP